MTAQPKVIAMPGTKPAERYIREHVPDSTYCFMIDGGGLRAMLNMATMLRDRCGEPFNIEAAAACRLVDADAGRIRKEADYCKMWGWSRQEYRTRLDKVMQRVSNWQTSYGRMPGKSNQVATNDQPTSNQEQADSVEESQSSNQLPTNEQPSSNQALPIDTRASALSSSAGDNPPTPPPREVKHLDIYPSLEEVTKHGTETLKCPEVVSLKFFNYFNPDWRDARGKPIPDWKLRFKQWWLEDQQEAAKESKQVTTNGQQQAGTGVRTADHQRPARTTGRVVATAQDVADDVAESLAALQRLGLDGGTQSKTLDVPGG